MRRLGCRGRAQYKAGDAPEGLPQAGDAVEPVDEAPDLSPGVAAAGDALDAEILRLLVPATLAVFLDPAMALIDTGGARGSWRKTGCARAPTRHAHPVLGAGTASSWNGWPENACMLACTQAVGFTPPHAWLAGRAQ